MVTCVGVVCVGRLIIACRMGAWEVYKDKKRVKEEQRTRRDKEMTERRIMQMSSSSRSQSDEGRHEVVTISRMHEDSLSTTESVKHANSKTKKTKKQGAFGQRLSPMMASRTEPKYRLGRDMDVSTQSSSFRK